MKKRLLRPEEYNKSISLQNHPYNRPAHKDQKEARTKGYSALYNLMKYHQSEAKRNQ